MINSTSHYKAMIDKDFSEYLKNFKCKFKEVNIETKIQGDYLYYCDKYFNISKLKNLTFSIKL